VICACVVLACCRRGHHADPLSTGRGEDLPRSALEVGTIRQSTMAAFSVPLEQACYEGRHWSVDARFELPRSSLEAARSGTRMGPCRMSPIRHICLESSTLPCSESRCGKPVVWILIIYAQSCLTASAGIAMVNSWGRSARRNVSGTSSRSCSAAVASGGAPGESRTERVPVNGIASGPTSSRASRYTSCCASCLPSATCDVGSCTRRCATPRSPPRCASTSVLSTSVCSARTCTCWSRPSTRPRSPAGCKASRSRPRGTSIPRSGMVSGDGAARCSPIAITPR